MIAPTTFSCTAFSTSRSVAGNDGQRMGCLPIFGGWSANPILSRESGLPFSVTSSGTSVNAPGNTQTADQVLPAVNILGGHGERQIRFALKLSF